MEVYVLDEGYNIVGMIDEAESVLWLKRYNDEGESEIYAPCTPEYVALLKIGHYLYRFDDDMFCKIEDVQIDTDAEEGDKIIATAKDICALLAGRIVRWQIAYSGTVAGFVKRLLLENVIAPEQTQRAIPDFVIDESSFEGLTATIDTTAFTEDLLNIIKTTCKGVFYGFRVSFDISARKLTFKLYKGKNKTSASNMNYIEFSPELSNILSSRYKESSASYKNVCYVGYKNSDDEFALLSVYVGDTEPRGEARREIYVDGSSVSRSIIYEDLLALFPDMQKNEADKAYFIVVDGAEQNVATYEINNKGKENEEEKITTTDYTHLLLIRTMGYNKLAEQTHTKEFGGVVDTIETYRYKTDYDLGDIVKVVNEYGIEADAQITEIMESEDTENHYEVEPRFEYIKED